MTLNNTDSPHGPGRASRGAQFAWLVGLFAVLTVLCVSVLWFLRDRDFEPALAVIAGLGATGTFLMKEGRRALLFCVGFVAGAVITAFLLRAVIQPAGEAAALPLSGEHKAAAEQADGDLRRQVSDLTRANESLSAEAAALRTQLQAARGGVSGAAANTPAPAGAEPAAAGSLQVKEVNDFVFTLRRCRATGGDIEVTLSVMNRGPDRTLSFNWGTNLVTVSEMMFKVDEVFIGGQRDTSTPFTSGVPLGVRLLFKGVASQVDGIKLLQLNVNGGQVEFRDVAVGREG